MFHTYVLPLDNRLVDHLPCGFCPVHQQLHKLFPSCVNLHGERFLREESEIFPAAAIEVKYNIKPHHLLEGFRIWRRWVVGGLDLF